MLGSIDESNASFKRIESIKKSFEIICSKDANLEHKEMHDKGETRVILTDIWKVGGKVNLISVLSYIFKFVLIEWFSIPRSFHIARCSGCNQVI